MKVLIKKILKEEVDSRSERIKSIVNKYGIKRAINMVAGGVDTIRQAYQDNLISFLNGFNDLTPVQENDIIYYVDENRLPLFYYYPKQKNGNVFINYDRIWLFFEGVFGLKYSETQSIIKNWLEETYNLRGLTPNCDIQTVFTAVGRNL